MNIFDRSTIVRVSVLVLSLTVLTRTAVSAQNTPISTSTPEQTRIERDDQMDWGSLGWLGLLGLTGLIPRKRTLEVRDDYRTPAR